LKLPSILSSCRRAIGLLAKPPGCGADLQAKRPHHKPVRLARCPESQYDEETERSQGYNAISWQGSGMNYSAVSDLNAVELREFADWLK
jgi:hypothetical protein